MFFLISSLLFDFIYLFSVIHFDPSLLIFVVMYCFLPLNSFIYDFR